MSEFEGHTLGPWDCHARSQQFDRIRIFSGSYYIASVGNTDDSHKQTDANARLIAAAPRLLAERDEAIANLRAADYRFTAEKVRLKKERDACLEALEMCRLAMHSDGRDIKFEDKTILEAAIEVADAAIDLCEKSQRNSKAPQ